MKIVLKELNGEYINANEGTILDIKEIELFKLLRDRIGGNLSTITLENDIIIFFNHQEKDSLGEEAIKRFNMKINNDLFIFDNCIFANVSNENEILSLTEYQLEFLSNIEVLRKEWNISCELYDDSKNIFSDTFKIEALRESDALFMANDIVNNMFPKYETIDQGMFLGSGERNIEYLDSITSKHVNCILRIVE